MNGPTIPISILGSGVEPRLVFSPKEVDFGMCFLQQAEMSPRRTTVVITNKEKEDMRLVITSLFQNRVPLCLCCTCLGFIVTSILLGC